MSDDSLLVKLAAALVAATAVLFGAGKWLLHRIDSKADKADIDQKFKEVIETLRDHMHQDRDQIYRVLERIAEEAKYDRHELANRMQEVVTHQAETNVKVAKEIGELRGAISK